MSDRLVVSFNTIKEFVEALKEEYPEEKGIVLYEKRLRQTGIKNKIAMKEHRNKFEAFFSEHGDKLTEKEYVNIPKDAKISYSSEIYIPIAKVLEESGDNRAVIFEYLSSIFALVSPEKQNVAGNELMQDLMGDVREFGEKIVKSGKLDSLKNSGKATKQDVIKAVPLLLEELSESGFLDNIINKMEGKEMNMDVGSIMGMLQGLSQGKK